jgi:hypothetical protein
MLERRQDELFKMQELKSSQEKQEISEQRQNLLEASQKARALIETLNNVSSSPGLTTTLLERSGDLLKRERSRSKGSNGSMHRSRRSKESLMIRETAFDEEEKHELPKGEGMGHRRQEATDGTYTNHLRA